jgi:V/A-type H+-transporting ATPase subunit I
MFKAKPMSRILIAASKDQLEPVIRELYQHNLFHIEEYVEAEDEAYEGFKIGMPMKGASETSSELLRIRSIINSVGVKPEDILPQSRRYVSDILNSLKQELPDLEAEVESIIRERTQIEATLKDYQQRIRDLEPFASVPGDLGLYRGYEQFAVFAGRIAADIEITVPHEKFFTDAVPGNFIVIIVRKEDGSDVERALLDAHFQSVPIPEESGTAEERIALYQQEILRLNAELETVEQKLEDLNKKHSEFLSACEEVFKAEVERTEAPLRFATTDETFVAEGWLPSDKVDTLKGSLLNATNSKVFVTEVEIDYQKDKVPVEYDNPHFASPTEALIDIYSRPLYSETDPTILVSIVFPIFFGLIVGDVGYGLVFLAMSFGLRKMMKGSVVGKQLLDSLRNAGVSTVIFGILFSEFFGLALPWDSILSRHLNIGGHAVHHPMVTELLILSIWIGILHITIGRAIGAINAKKLYHGKHATKVMIANIGWIAVMYGILTLVLSIFPIPYFPDMSGMPVVAQGVGIVLVLAGLVAIAQDNVLEVVELPTIVSHVLSYARLAAVGLSSVAIAMVVNFLAIGMMIEPQLENLSLVGVLIIIFGIIVLVIGQTLNIALGLLGGGLHSIRLHYVEFFTKFYKGGGIIYKPFGMKKRFSED